MVGLLILVTQACQTPTSSETETSTTTPTEIKGQTFGEALTMEGIMPYGEVVSKVLTADSIPAKIAGTVESVCQAKGCWMDIVGDQEGQPNMMVRFKDYGFFVPKDIAGRQVVLEGYAFREVTSVEELRHYAEDEGLPQEEIDKITEPREDLKFLASGVIVLDEEG